MKGKPSVLALHCFNDLAAKGNLCHPDPQGPGLPCPSASPYPHLRIMEILSCRCLFLLIGITSGWEV